METHESINPEWSKYNSDSKRIMAVGSKSFFAASRLFPKRLSNPATIIYAYCRLADDLVDYGGGEEAVRELNHRLDAIYEGQPQNLGVDKDFANAYPCFPLDLFEINLIGSIYSCVGPAVTSALYFLFLDKFLK